MSSVKLAFKNVGKSLRDYAVYFLTLSLGVCIFYVFNAMDSQTLLIGLTAAQGGVLKMLAGSLDYTSVFVSAILAFLILYANKFLMRRRKKELGVYLLLGMPKGKVSFVLAMETALIGVFALVTGLVVGILLSQGLSVLVASMFQVKLEVFHFVFSGAALVKTLLYFGAVFLVVMLLNMQHVSRCKLVTLFNSERANERAYSGKLWISVIAFLASAACLGYAYQQIIDNGLVLLNAQFNRAILFGVLGTLLFFFSLSGFLLKLIKGNKTLYYRGLNSFVFRQLNSKINTNFLSMTFVCLMLFFAIAVTATGSGINYAITKSALVNTPYDATLTFDAKGEQQARDQMEQNGVEIGKYFEQSALFSYRETGIAYADYLQAGDFPFGIDVNRRTFDAISLSEYNELMRMQGKKEIALGEGEYAVSAAAEKAQGAGQKLLDTGAVVHIGERQYLPGSAPLQTRFLETMSANPVNLVLILPDDAAAQFPVSRTYLAGNYHNGDREKYDPMLDAQYEGESAQWQGIRVTTAGSVLMMETGTKAMLLFILLYLGIIFLIAASAVLALQQLSETADNVSRYTLLRKLGVDDDMARKAMRRQVALYFFVPLALALVHSAVAIYVVNQMIIEFKVTNSLLNILCAAGLLLVLYGIYYLATYQSCKGMIRERSVK